jgi:hypothetical protein
MKGAVPVFGVVAVMVSWLTDWKFCYGKGDQMVK